MKGRHHLSQHSEFTALHPTVPTAPDPHLILRTLMLWVDSDGISDSYCWRTLFLCQQLISSAVCTSLQSAFPSQFGPKKDQLQEKWALRPGLVAPPQIISSRVLSSEMIPFANMYEHGLWILQVSFLPVSFYSFQIIPPNFSFQSSKKANPFDLLCEPSVCARPFPQSSGLQGTTK